MVDLKDFSSAGSFAGSYTVALLVSLETEAPHEQRSELRKYNQVTLQCSLTQIKNMAVSFALDLNEHFLDIYTNGSLLTSSNASKVTFGDVKGSFYPVIRTRGGGVQVDSISCLPMPHAIPDVRFIVCD